MSEMRKSFEINPVGFEFQMIQIYLENERIFFIATWC